MRRYEEHLPSIFSEDQNGDFSLGKRSGGTWDTGMVARRAPETPGAPSPPDTHALVSSYCSMFSHTIPQFIKYYMLYLYVFTVSIH